MSETFEVSKEEYLQFKVSQLEQKIADVDANIEKYKQKKQAFKDEIDQIKEANRDVFPLRGRRKKAE